MTPWYTSDDLISAIKRKISFPISQNTFSEEDVLAFCNEEMMISQVPSVLQYHQEYFSTTYTVDLLPNVSRYEIPERCIGGKFQNLFFQDTSGNLFDMTRIDKSNKAFFQDSGVNINTISKYYLEGNYIVIVPEVGPSPVGSLVFDYYLRPNQLVLNERAAICTGFAKTLTITNASLVAGDTISIGDEIFTAVASGAGVDEFNIGANSDATASNLSAAITTSGIGIGTVANNVVTVTYTNLDTTFDSSNEAGIAVQNTQTVVFDDVPDNITDGSVVDFLQTKSGHRTKAIDITIPSSGVSANTITFTSDDVPSDFIVGDYICLANECIIPQIPTDLHNALAERACSRILAAIGDQQGLAATNQKLEEIEVRQGVLLDNRVDGQPTKVLARKSLLRYGKIGWRRWL